MNTYIKIFPKDDWVLVSIILVRAKRLTHDFIGFTEELGQFNTLGESYDFYRKLPTNDTQGYIFNRLFKIEETSNTIPYGATLPYGWDRELKEY